jgi:thymidylate synthase
MDILAVVTGEFGRRKAQNLREHGPKTWTVNSWTAPSRFPIVIDEPRDFLPEALPSADLILALGETPGIAELLPDVAKMTGARSLIAPVDRVEWMPKGLMNQLRTWLKDMGVASVFPKPFCTLTETSYSIRGQRVEYSDPVIAEFARYFGKPRIQVSVDPESKTIAAVQVERDATCGCMRFIAREIIGTRVDDAEFQAGMLHHHYPCLASMGIDPDYSDTLLHVSGDISRDAFAAAVKPYRTTHYFRPDGFVEKKD